MKYDPFRLTANIPSDGLRRRALDLLLNIGIPFNRWLGYRVEAVSEDRVVVRSSDVILRRNHVGGAHACALALMGEYAAGLVIAQTFPVESYRVIIGELRVVYKKQGRGVLRGEAVAPEAWPEFDDDDQTWIEMKTLIRDSANEVVAECFTKWQVKQWSKVRGAKAAGA